MGWKGIDTFPPLSPGARSTVLRGSKVGLGEYSSKTLTRRMYRWANLCGRNDIAFTFVLRNSRRNKVCDWLDDCGGHTVGCAIYVVCVTCVLPVSWEKPNGRERDIKNRNPSAKKTNEPGSGTERTLNEVTLARIVSSVGRVRPIVENTLTLASEKRLKSTEVSKLTASTYWSVRFPDPGNTVPVGSVNSRARVLLEPRVPPDLEIRILIESPCGESVTISPTVWTLAASPALFRSAVSVPNCQLNPKSFWGLFGDRNKSLKLSLKLNSSTSPPGLESSIDRSEMLIVPARVPPSPSPPIRLLCSKPGDWLVCRVWLTSVA